MSAEDITNNPPKVFTEPCEACGVSEFQLGVEHERKRIIEIIESLNCEANGIEHDCDPLGYYSVEDLIAVIQGKKEKIELSEPVSSCGDCKGDCCERL